MVNKLLNVALDLINEQKEILDEGLHSYYQNDIEKYLERKIQLFGMVWVLQKQAKLAGYKLRLKNAQDFSLETKGTYILEPLNGSEGATE